MDTAIESSTQFGDVLEALSSLLPFVAISAGTLSIIILVYFLVSLIIKIQAAKNTKIMQQNIKEIRITLKEMQDFQYSQVTENTILDVEAQKTTNK